MKTNRRKPFILATLALGLVLVMGLGANTFAKYLTEDAGTDTARVAKWGVTAENTLAGLFGEDYTADVIDDTDAEVSLNSTAYGAGDLLAPGTEGSATFTITGIPEVSCNVTATLTIVDKVHVGTYRPITWTLTGDTLSWTEVTDGNATEFAGVAEVGDRVAVIAIDQDYTPGEDLARTLNLSWAWEFEQGNDAADTTLGDAATARVNVTYSVTIAQLDQNA